VKSSLTISEAMATTSASEATAAPQISQRSCSRSTPRARRYRSSSATAPTIRETRTTRAANMSRASAPDRAGTPSGLAMSGYSGRSGAGSTIAPSSHTTAAAAAILAHQRQRGDGSRPVGVSSSTKPAQAIHCTTAPLLSPAR
jgi:hypothetical protein